MHSTGALGVTCGGVIGLSAALATIFSRLGHHRAASAQPISRAACRLRRLMPVIPRKKKATESLHIAFTKKISRVPTWSIETASYKQRASVNIFKPPASTSHLTEDPNAGSANFPLSSHMPLAQVDSGQSTQNESHRVLTHSVDTESYKQRASVNIFKPPASTSHLTEDPNAAEKTGQTVSVLSRTLRQVYLKVTGTRQDRKISHVHCKVSVCGQGS